MGAMKKSIPNWLMQKIGFKRIFLRKNQKNILQFAKDNGMINRNRLQASEGGVTNAEY